MHCSILAVPYTSNKFVKINVKCTLQNLHKMDTKLNVHETL